MAKHWYIVHTHTGFENKVKTTLEERIKLAGQEEFFGKILVPTEQVVEMVKGARKTSERKFFPGYILIHMEMNEPTWHTVQETPRAASASAAFSTSARRVPKDRSATRPPSRSSRPRPISRAVPRSGISTPIPSPRG